MSELEVLRAIKGMLPDGTVVRLEVGNYERDIGTGMVIGSDESRLVVLSGDMVHPFVVSAEDWAMPEALIAMIISMIRSRT